MQERESMRWLQLTYKVPSEPSQKRVWVWRHLQSLGAYALQNSVYLLPFSSEVEKKFRQLAQEIQEMGGEASLFSVVALDSTNEDRILQALLEARNTEYTAVVKHCAQFLGRISEIAERQRWDANEQAGLADTLEKLHALFRTAKRHDMLGALTAAQRAIAAEALAVCEQGFRLLIEKEYIKVSHLLEAHRDVLAGEQLSVLDVDTTLLGEHGYEEGDSKA